MALMIIAKAVAIVVIGVILLKLALVYINRLWILISALGKEARASIPW
jgi:hypothetical protein